MYYVANHLDKFSNDTYPRLTTKFVAFVIWISGVGRLVARLQITFMFGRQFMFDAKLLSTFNVIARTRKIERWLRPATFAFANSGIASPILAPKISRVNLHVSRVGPNHNNSNREKGGVSCEFRGHGNYNRNYKPSKVRNPPRTRSHVNDGFTTFDPPRASQLQQLQSNDTTPSSHPSRVVITTVAFHVEGRILD